MSKKTFYKIIFTVAVAICLLCLVLFIKFIIPTDSHMEQYYNETTVSEPATESVEETTTLPDNPINFKKLKKTNSDVYAWIKIPDTNVDYAIAQSSDGEDDNFYLSHNINKDYEFAGMIYSQRKNSTDFSDFVTVLYGHDMLNGSMFATLAKFKDSDFFDKHENFYVYTPGHILTYQVVAAYVYDDRHILNTFDFDKKADRKEYIDSILNPKSMVKNVREGIKLTRKSNILTLSTCTGVDSQRYLVQGVLIDDELTK